ncbi:MAG: hypothetical protein HUU38_04965 [Anaerolineales bacterium]|nr:hypothetical protein [Anaerolineales bacterium]
MTIGTRMMNDLLQAERQRRESAERTTAEMRKLLTEIGARLAGERLQAIGRDDPQIIANWTTTEWRTFLNETLKTSLPPTWGNGALSPSPSKTEFDRLKSELTQAHALLETLKQEREIVPMASPRLESNSPGSDFYEPVPKSSSSPIQPAGVHGQILTALQNWAPPAIPARFDGHLSPEPLQWRRQSMALFILAKFGLNARLELDRLIADTEGIQPGSGSLRRAINQLSERHLFTGALLEMNSPQTRLSLVRLSEESRALCKILGWEPVESEWERLDRLHEGARFPEHTLAVLVFAMHARLRGYAVTLMPETEGPAVPDGLVEKEGERFFVEVELGTKERPAKWRNLAALQGRIAICARDPAGRERQVGDCQLARLRGVATDIKSLVRTRFKDITPATPLWVEAWD